MYFLLHLPLHKRQALSPIEEKTIQQRESAFSSKRNPPRTQSQKEPPHDSPEKDRRARSSKGILRAISPTRDPRTCGPGRNRRARSPGGSLRTCGPTRDPLRMRLRKKPPRMEPRKGASAHAAPQEIPAHAASEEFLRTAALKGNRRVRNAGMHQPPQKLRYKLNQNTIRNKIKLIYKR